METKVAVLLAVAACLAVLVEAHNHNRHTGRPSRHVKRHLEEFLEPPPPPRSAPGPPGPPGSVVRSRRGNAPPPGAAPAPPGSSPSLSLGERIARWFYAGPNDGPGGPGKTHGSKGPPLQAPTMVGLSPPPPPPGMQQHSAPPPDAMPHTAEAVALMEQKPPPPQSHQAHPPPSQDQHASGTEHHAQGYQGNHGNQGYQQQQQQQNYPVLMPQSYLRTTDCNPCNNVPWIPMSRAHATGNSNGNQQDSYGPPAAGEAWGQASDAVPLAHAPIPFPALHKGPLPPVFPAEDFTRVPPESPQPAGLRDHLVPPTPEHDSVVFTINEEQRPEPEHTEHGPNDLGAEGEVKAAPDQLHQGTLQHHHALQHQVSGHAQHNVPHLAQHHAQHHVQHHAQHHVQHHVPPPANAVPDHVPYSAAKGGGGVELVQSVPIASYLASIEYPMTFIQSPLIEIPVKSVPHGFVPQQPQQPQQHYQVVAPTPLSAASQHVDVHQTHAGSLPLQGEHQAGHAARLADSSSASSAAIQHHNLPPCRHYAALAAAVQANNNLASQYAAHHHHQHHDDAATANSQTSHAFAQELGHFESQKVSPTAAPNNYRLLEDGATASSAASSTWPSTSAAPPTVAWDASAAATVTADGASGYSAPSAPSGTGSGPTGPGKGAKKTKQIQIIVPYTIDKETGQVRLHSELMPDELSGAGAEAEGVISYTPPPDLPPSAGALPSGLEALVQQTARKVPHGVSATDSPQQQHQAQESVVVAELSPTPWHAAAPAQQDKAPGAADPFAGLQHILATDLRTLLRNEEDSVDRLRLQKNIDNWTAQEYSSLKSTRDTEAQEANPGVVTFNFTSTTASAGTSPSASASSSASSAHGKLNPSKKIPKEYLTTTPLSVSAAPTTTPAPTARSTPRRKDTEPTKRPAKIHNVRKNATRDDRKTKNGWTLVENLVVPGPTTPATRSTPPPATPDNHRPSEQTRAPWERLQVSISPLTREKVYVVTPQTPGKGEATTASPTPSPTAALQTSAGTTAADANKHININDLSPFRKWMDTPTATPSPAAPASSSTQHTRPRFSIRPTPGWPKPRPHGFRSTQAQASTTAAAPTAERLASTGTETTPTPVTDKVTKSSRATPRGFAVETISGHSKVFTATTSAWSKNKKAVESDNKKSTTAKPTTASAGSRTTRALKGAESKDAVVEAVTASPSDTLRNHRVDLSDIDAEASASVLHRHVAQLTPLGAAVLKASTTTEPPSTPSTPSSSGSTDDGATETPSLSGPEIVIVEGRREVTTATATTAATTVETTEASTATPDASTNTASTAVTEASATSSRTTRAIKTIGRRPDGSRYILTEEEAKQQNGLAAQRTKLQAVTTPKKYESPPPRPKPPKQAAAEALFRRKPSRRPPHLVMTPDRGSYLWNFSEFSGTSHEDMVEDDVTAIKGAVVELKKEAEVTPASTLPEASSASAAETTPTPTTPAPESSSTSAAVSTTTPTSSSAVPAVSAA